MDLTTPEAKAAIAAEAAKIAAEQVTAETAALKATNDAIKAEKVKLADKLKAVPEDFDAEAWKKFRADETKRAEDDAQKKGEWDKLKGSMEQKLNETTTKLTGERDNAVKRYEEYFVRNEIVSAIAKADGVPEILISKVRESVKLIPGENGGADVVVVVNKDGTPRIKDAKGTPYGLDDLLGELKTDETWSRGFKASGASGGGAGGGGGKGGKAKVLTRAEFGKLTHEDRKKFTKDGGTLTD
ncbi:MAG: hypothetical protein Q8N51_00850 [Gammaproteobacteria bacterium]|nr:hypothetical protein [Gammaproteobacteria bacterium]